MTFGPLTYMKFGQSTYHTANIELIRQSLCFVSLRFYVQLSFLENFLKSFKSPAKLQWSQS